MATTKKMTTFIFGFTCPQNIFAVTNELKEPTQARVDRVICSAVGTALAVYLLFAGSAYLTFGELVESDILNNYPGNRVVTAAMAAAADDAARALLEARDDDGWSPLHYAANAGSAEVVAFLLASGADRLARDRWGAGVADAARHAKHRDVVRLLVGPSEPPPQKKRGPPAVVPRRRRAPVGAAT